MVEKKPKRKGLPIREDIHQKLKIRAAEEGMTVMDLGEKALAEYLSKPAKKS